MDRSASIGDDGFSMSAARGTGIVGERCSTCGRSGPDVARLFPVRAGNAGLLICDHCVRECEEAIADVPTRIPGAAHACAFCTKTEGEVAIMIGIGSSMICDECVDAYRAQLG
jgi:ATP-dependent protease Clp ATPase subunit